MTTDNTTANVLSSKSGTGWTIDVTACNLDTDLSIKDFVVLINDSLSPNSNFDKTSATVLTYTGSSISTSTVEVRRSTPNSRLQEVTFGSRISSALYNGELNRIARRAYEYALNGTGAQAVTTIQTPKDDPFGVAWSGDTVYPPTRGRVYDEMITKAALASPTFTGTPTAPTPSAGDNTTKIATTAFTNTAISGALSTSPSLGGVPSLSQVVPYPDSTQRPASTIWVNTAIAANLALRAKVRNELYNGFFQWSRHFRPNTTATLTNSKWAFWDCWSISALGGAGSSIPNLSPTFTDTPMVDLGHGSRAMTVGSASATTVQASTGYVSVNTFIAGDSAPYLAAGGFRLRFSAKASHSGNLWVRIAGTTNQDQTIAITTAWQTFTIDVAAAALTSNSSSATDWGLKFQWFIHSAALSGKPGSVLELGNNTNWSLSLSNVSVVPSAYSSDVVLPDTRAESLKRVAEWNCCNIPNFNGSTVEAFRTQNYHHGMCSATATGTTHYLNILEPVLPTRGQYGRRLVLAPTSSALTHTAFLNPWDLTSVGANGLGFVGSYQGNTALVSVNSWSIATSFVPAFLIIASSSACWCSFYGNIYPDFW